MFRHIVGFALLGFLVLVGVRLAFDLFGLTLALAATVAILGAAGYVGYLLLQVLSPTAAAKLQRWIDRTASELRPGSGVRNR
jgi:hypothetical protein